MSLKKIFLGLMFLGVFTFFVSSANAMTADELKAKISNLQSQVNILLQQLNTAQQQTTTPSTTPNISASSNICYNFAKTLKLGSVGDDVKGLQILLKKEGLYPGNLTGYFGQFTKTALIKFQEKYTSDILSPWKLKKGTGNLGSSTMAKLNKLFGCTNPNLTPKPTTCTPNWSCSGFGTCTNGLQTQTCTDKNSCGVTTGEPFLAQPCTITPTVGILNSVVDANNQLALDLYSKYKSEKGNVFFSPYSILSVLAIAYEGARGTTASEMQAVLHLPNDKGKIHSDFVNISNEINKAGKSYQLSVANDLWAQKDYTFLTDYFNTVAQYYDGKLTNLDFKSDTENSRITINDWVANKTNNKIQNLIPQGTVGSSTRLVITNAIYFKADWLRQFDGGDTYDQDFKLDSGNTVKAKMMHNTANLNYGETDTLQLLEMPYVGNDLSMIIFLPKDNNLINLDDSISINNLSNWKNAMKNERVAVSLPKFKFDTDYFMSKDLKEMGMPTAFTGNADFSGMTGTKDLYISEVIHKAFVEVAEYGTEAAAATAVIMRAMAVPMPQEPPKVFNADHPFIFTIQDNQSGNILFMGRVLDPTK